MEKERLDVLITDQGLAESRSLAQRLVMAGQVRVNGQVVLKPSVRIDVSSQIQVEHGPRFVSRGGEKLDAAMEAFDLASVEGCICADIGSSTGGFTDCLLQRGAQKVFAVDVGYGILHWKIRQDPRVVVMEKTNARFVEHFEQPVSLIVIDASFISLKILLPAAKKWYGEQGGRLVALIKPQFEAGREDAAKGEGVIRDPALHKQILEDILGYAQNEGFEVQGLIRSPLLGPKGNTEFLVNLQYPGNNRVEIDRLVAEAVNP